MSETGDQHRFDRDLETRCHAGFTGFHTVPSRMRRFMISQQQEYVHALEYQRHNLIETFYAIHKERMPGVGGSWRDGQYPYRCAKDWKIVVMTESMLTHARNVLEMYQKNHAKLLQKEKVEEGGGGGGAAADK